jgi:hypothetical protein
VPLTGGFYKVTARFLSLGNGDYLELNSIDPWLFMTFYKEFLIWIFLTISLSLKLLVFCYFKVKSRESENRFDVRLPVLKGASTERVRLTGLNGLAASTD